MADGLDPKSLAVVLLLISILFHYFSFAFTVVAFDYAQYDISLNIDEMYSSGIMLGPFDEHNITYGNTTYTLFEIENKTIRTRWIDWPVLATEDVFTFDDGDGLAFQWKRDFFSVDTFAPFFLQNIEKGRLLRNESMIALWDTSLNHTKVLGKAGHVLFITDPLRQGNITRAVQETGNITLTIAKNMDFVNQGNLGTFVSWYIGLVTGSEAWGLPPSFSILVRIMTMLGIFSGIFLMIEARRLIKIL